MITNADRQKCSSVWSSTFVLASADADVTGTQDREEGGVDFGFYQTDSILGRTTLTSRGISRTCRGAERIISGGHKLLS